MNNKTCNREGKKKKKEKTEGADLHTLKNKDGRGKGTRTLYWDQSCWFHIVLLKPYTNRKLKDLDHTCTTR